MGDRVFLDTNLWVYFFVKEPPEKEAKVREIIELQPSLLVISTQTLGELCNVLLRKSSFSSPEVQGMVLDLVDAFQILEINASNIFSALAINTRYGYSYWDSLIIATALQSNCSVLYSEDMQHDQWIEGKLRIVNPFVA